MATHSSIAAWRIPRTEERGGPQPTGSQSGQSTQTPSPGLKLLGREQHTGLWAARTLGFDCGGGWFAAILTRRESGE